MNCTICHHHTGYPTMLDIDTCDDCQSVIDMFDDWDVAVLANQIRQQLV